jgi:SPP1 family predicted phage head-tail adaptor
MMAPGELNRRLVLEAPVESADGTGGVTRSYPATMTLWAKVEPVSARRAVVADAPGATITHRITVRRRSAVTTRHRFVEGTTVYRIVTIRDDATRRFLVIGAEQRTDQQDHRHVHCRRGPARRDP